MKRAVVVAGIVVIAIGLVTWLWPEKAAEPPGDEAVALLSEADSAEFEQALAPRPFVFPEDHGPHPGFRQEWWYYTGNLRSADGRRFGYQLTFFRFALAPRPSARTSPWAADQVYLAHFALSDVSGGRHYQFERSSRGAAGLAGAEAAPFRVWLEDWSVTGKPEWPMVLRAETPEVGIELRLESAKPVVLQGENGLSQKGAAPGNASYYYSYTRLPGSGTVRIGDKRFDVAGTSWMDREWSSSALEKAQAGWDWFALQLDSGEDLMFYQLRRRDGSIDVHSRGVWVDAAGRTRPLLRDEIQLDVEAEWGSPASGARYPAGWRLRVPALHLDLRVRPHLADQEMRQRFRYWEGAVGVSGQHGERAVAGNGYAELVGYTGGVRKR